MFNWLFRRTTGGSSEAGSDTSIGSDLRQRPGGTLIWVHHEGGLTKPQEQACFQMQDDLRNQEGVEVGFLLSSPNSDVHSTSNMAYTPAPETTEEAYRLFLAQWRPDMVVFLSPVVDPIGNLPSSLGAQTVHVRKTTERLSPPSNGTDLVLQTEDSSVLSPVPSPPKCNDAEAEALAAVLHGRPSWLSAVPAQFELKHVLETHQQACRIAHRLLLFLVVSPDMVTEVQALCASMDLVTATREDDGEPFEETAVFLISGQDEMGIWYRLAPVTLVGGSFSNAVQIDPNHPAAMGSAVLIGPNAEGYQQEADSLVSADAARLVADDAALPKALIDLLSPDVAANLASNAWSVTSRGATVQNALIEEILEVHDAVEASMS
jgi:hypothetical protein